MQFTKAYSFTKFSSDLELLSITHSHKIRREEEQTLLDEYALEELKACYPILWEQYLEGWSRSYYQGSKHMDAILQYSWPDIPESKLQQAEKEAAISELKERLASLRRVRAYDVLTELDQVRYEPTSSAGYDYTGPKGPRDGDNHSRAIRRAKAIMWSITKPDGQGLEHAIETSVPDVGYTRTQLTELSEKTKVRGVWGRAFHYIILEGTTAQPLLDAFREGTTFFHIGQDPLVSVPETLSRVSATSPWLCALDWSAFDATVSRFEIDLAFDLLKEKIDFPNSETEAVYELCRQLFIHKKIAAPDGNVYWSHKGIPSGSYFTSIIGSIVNRFRIEYLWRTVFKTKPDICYTQGDDSITGCQFYPDPAKLAKQADKYGWTLNPAKTKVSRVPEYVEFLGRTIYGGLNQRDLKKCLRLLVFPEYKVESGRISAYRAASIHEDSGYTSEVLGTIARRLRRKYGVASEEEVPRYFRRYNP